jgi:NhaP-type Na+/H+ and K+/H+ antiporter
VGRVYGSSGRQYCHGTLVLRWCQIHWWKLIYGDFLSVGRFAPTSGSHTHDLLESEGQLLFWMVLTLLGWVFAAPTLQAPSPAQWGYALLALAVVRMLPVALSPIGTSFSWPTVAFLEWFGPRVLASLLFDLLLVEGELEGGESFFNVVLLTVLLGVMLPGWLRCLGV